MKNNTQKNILFKFKRQILSIKNYGELNNVMVIIKMVNCFDKTVPK